MGTRLVHRTTPLKAFRSLDVPVLYMVGKRSTPSARGAAGLLVSALPRVELVEFENLGHTGPVTHPDLVNEAIGQFLERVEQQCPTTTRLCDCVSA
jgi:pimeloyl-ACP methyl ester carboxylesterase